jgi:hypothetical protein
MKPAALLSFSILSKAAVQFFQVKIQGTAVMRVRMKVLLGTSHFLISATLPIASAEPIATEKCIKDSDRASTLSSFA